VFRDTEPISNPIYRFRSIESGVYLSSISRKLF
jgi:hypothetical protein